MCHLLEFELNCGSDSNVVRVPPGTQSHKKAPCITVGCVLVTSDALHVQERVNAQQHPLQSLQPWTSDWQQLQGISLRPYHLQCEHPHKKWIPQPDPDTKITELAECVLCVQKIFVGCVPAKPLLRNPWKLRGHPRHHGHRQQFNERNVAGKDRDCNYVICNMTAMTRRRR